MKKVTLLIASEDNNWIARLKDSLLEKEYNIMWIYRNAEILDKFYDYNTDIDYIVIGQRYPDYDMNQIITTIRSISDVPILIMAENMDEDIQISFYKAGVEAYLPYTFSAKLLDMKIQIINKYWFGKNDVLEEGILEINPFRKKVKVDGKEVNITVKEFELLYYLIMNKRVIQTRDQILTAVWGINYMGNDRVVDSLVKKLRNKLGKASAYIKTVYAMGYYFEASEKDNV